MGTWGPHIFDNDVAADWLKDVGQDDARAVEAALDALLHDESDAPYGTDLCLRALAAAQLVARQIGSENGAFTGLQGKAVLCVAAAAKPSSELSALWQDAGVEAHEDWIATLQILQAELRGEQPATQHTAITDLPQAQLAEGIELRLRGIEVDIRNLRADILDEFQKMRRFMKEQQA